MTPNYKLQHKIIKFKIHYKVIHGTHWNINKFINIFKILGVEWVILFLLYVVALHNFYITYYFPCNNSNLFTYSTYSTCVELCTSLWHFLAVPSLFFLFHRIVSCVITLQITVWRQTFTYFLITNYVTRNMCKVKWPNA